MPRATDVQLMMTRVATALVRNSRGSQRPGGTIFVQWEGDDDMGIASLRVRADVHTELPSGSDRPVVGPAIRLAKRAVRRGLRWYVAPMIEEQSRFNHDVLDLMETLRLRNERLAAEVEALRGGGGNPESGDLAQSSDGRPGPDPGDSREW